MADKYYRLVCFVVDICADVLRKYFVKLAEKDVGSSYTTVDAYLAVKQQDIDKLYKRKIIRKDQHDLLYPRHGTADENKWDVTLLVTLITELFSSYINSLDSSTMKTEIRGIRNDLQHYRNTENMSDNDFDTYWGRLETAIIYFAKKALDPPDASSLQGKIKKAKCNNLPNLGDCLRHWYEESRKLYEERIHQLEKKVTKVESYTKETNDTIRQVTVQKPGPSGEKDQRLKVADNILARFQARFESTMSDLPNDFNAPNEVTDIRTKLREHHHVVVTGSNNSRYLETALAAITGMGYNYKRSVEIQSSSDWLHIDPHDIDLVVYRDPFGDFAYDEYKARAMADIFDNMVHSTKVASGDKSLDIIIVTDLRILEECKMHRDHEILEEVIKVFTDTSVTQPVDLTIGCRTQTQYTASSLVPLFRNVEVMTRNFIRAYQVQSSQVDSDILRGAKNKLKASKAIVVTGPKKCGKTSIAVALASSYEISRCLLLKEPNDVNQIDFPNISLVIIDEFAGKYRFEKYDVYKWYTMFDHLYNAVIAGQMNVIIICDKSKLDKCVKEVAHHAILDHVIDVSTPKKVIKQEVEENEIEPKTAVTSPQYHSEVTPSDKPPTNIMTYKSRQTRHVLQQIWGGDLPLDLSRQSVSVMHKHQKLPAQAKTVVTRPQYDSEVTPSDKPSTNIMTYQGQQIPHGLQQIRGGDLPLDLSRQSVSVMLKHQKLPAQGIQYPIQTNGDQTGMKRVLHMQQGYSDGKRPRSLGPHVWSVKEYFQKNTKTNSDVMNVNVTDSCILPSGEIMLVDTNNNKLKKLNSRYEVISTFNLPVRSISVCYIGDNVVVVASSSFVNNQLHFVDTRHDMRLVKSVDTDNYLRAFACHGDRIYARDSTGSIYTYSKDGIKQQVLYTPSEFAFSVTNSIAVSDDGSKLYVPYNKKLVTIDSTGKELFSLNHADIRSESAICVDDLGNVFVSTSSNSILQISADGQRIVGTINNSLNWNDINFVCTMLFDRKQLTLVVAGHSNTINVLKTAVMKYD